MGTPRACKGFIESGDRTSLPLGDGGPVPSRRFRPALAASQYTYRGTQLGAWFFQSRRSRHRARAGTAVQVCTLPLQGFAAKPPV